MLKIIELATVLGPTSIRKKIDGSLVTDLDITFEKLLVQKILQLYPSAVVIAEEGSQCTVESNASSGSTSRDYWIIDPIDGTENFANGTYDWCTLISRYYDGAVETMSLFPQKIPSIYYFDGINCHVGNVVSNGISMNRYSSKKCLDGPIITTNEFLQLFSKSTRLELGVIGSIGTACNYFLFGEVSGVITKEYIWDIFGGVAASMLSQNAVLIDLEKNSFQPISEIDELFNKFGMGKISNKLSEWHLLAHRENAETLYFEYRLKRVSDVSK